MIKRSLRIHTRRSSLPPATSPPLSLTPTCSQIQPQLKFPHIYLKFLPTPPPTCRALRPPRPQLQPGTICLLPEDLNQSFQQHICTSNFQQHFQSTPTCISSATLLYCPAYHGLNIYCPAPRIAGYQSPFPFVCASWTGV